MSVRPQACGQAFAFAVDVLAGEWEPPAGCKRRGGELQIQNNHVSAVRSIRRRAYLCRVDDQKKPQRLHVPGAQLPHLPQHVPGLHWKIGEIPGWLRQTNGEKRWPVTVGVLIAITMQVMLPDRYALQPKFLVPGLEAVLLAGLIVANPVRFQREHPIVRWSSLAMTVLIAVTNFASIVRLINQILHHNSGQPSVDAVTLLGSGVAIWITNILVFALFYWEFDRGGPFARAEARTPYPDFLFVQMTDPSKASPDWEPTFIDYAYLSYTNSTSFSPTDTMPMASWAKLSMMLQSGVSLVTLALVAARAVNILP